MRNGKCSRCGSPTVHSMPNGIVPSGGSREYMTMGNGIYTAANSYTFLCVSCGYFENYLTDVKKLAETAQKWPQVPVQG